MSPPIAVLLLVVGIGVVILCVTAVPGISASVVWYTVATVLVLRYTTCRYRVVDVSLIATGTVVPCIWSTSLGPAVPQGRLPAYAGALSTYGT
jgi:hypothetical protein